MNDNYRLKKVIFFDNLLGGFFKAEDHLSYYFCLYDYEIQYKLIEAYYNKESDPNYFFYRFEERRIELFNELTAITKNAIRISNDKEFEKEVINGIRSVFKKNSKISKWDVPKEDYSNFIKWDTDEKSLQWILFDYYEIRIAELVL
jgi:hypothetical protein